MVMCDVSILPIVAKTSTPNTIVWFVFVVVTIIYVLCALMHELWMRPQFFFATRVGMVC